MRVSTLGPKFMFFCTISITVLLTIVVMQNLTPTRENVDQARLLLQKFSCTKDMKYILQWTKPDTIPFISMGQGQETFRKRKCKHQNCFVTSDRNFFKDITMFNVVAFHGPEVIWMKNNLPKRRSHEQKYVFASIESSDYYPVCDTIFNGFFNWTWTYKLDSDEPYGYITIRDGIGDVIGPKTDMHWLDIDVMKPIKDEVKEKLNNKKKAAAWMVSNCAAKSGRQHFVKKVQKELELYGLTVDVYGKCGSLRCPDPSTVVEKMEEYQPMHPHCLKVIERDYYFYFSLENSFAEDYVTEKLLHALQNYAVPVVFGGANYSRFMPDGIYLNGRELGAKRLAAKMYEAINNQELYYNYFKWRNHYSYHSREESPDSDDYCRMCEMVNDERLMTETSVYDDFKKWWNPPGKC